MSASKILFIISRQSSPFSHNLEAFLQLLVVTLKTELLKHTHHFIFSLTRPTQLLSKCAVFTCSIYLKSVMEREQKKLYYTIYFIFLKQMKDMKRQKTTINNPSSAFCWKYSLEHQMCIISWLKIVRNKCPPVVYSCLSLLKTAVLSW